jgi:hypothetical protein
VPAAVELDAELHHHVEPRTAHRPG